MLLNEALWLAYLDLKLVDVKPTYVSTLLPQVTVVQYTMLLARHSPSRGHAAFLGQLHFFSVMGFSLFLSIFLLFPSMIVFTLGMQLYEILTVF